MMKKVKVAEATNLQLDWMVCKAGGGGKNIKIFIDGHSRLGMFNYTTDWNQMGPIIERELLSPDPLLDTNCTLIKWRCQNWKGDGRDYYGPTPLIAAARCYVASKLGDEVEVPEELS